MNSGVSSYMWMKPCSSRSTSFGMWREVLGLAVQEDRDVFVAIADFLDEGAQVGDGLLGRFGRELLVVDRQDEGRRAALLLR